MESIGFRKTTEDYIFSAVIFIVMGFLCFGMAYPFYYIVSYSISNPSRILPGFLWGPKGFSIQSYSDVLAFGKIINALMISVLRSIITPTFMLLVTTMAAYALSKKQLYGRKILLLIIVLTMYIDPGLIPSYLRISSLNLPRTFWVYVLPYLINAFSLILVKTYMESISPSLEESAWIDGAGYFTSFFRIMLPVCIPIIAAISLFSIVEQWNAYMDTMLYNAEVSSLHTLSYVLMQYIQNTMNIFEQTRNLSQEQGRVINTMSIRMAVTTISIIPIIFVYPFLQKYFVKGIMIGAIKG